MSADSNSFLQEAENALKFYRGYSDSVLRKELEKLKNTLTNSKNSDKFQIKDLCKCQNSKFFIDIFFNRKLALNLSLICMIGNRKALKGLGVGVMLGVFSHFTANFVIISRKLELQ